LPVRPRLPSICIALLPPEPRSPCRGSLVLVAQRPRSLVKTETVDEPPATATLICAVAAERAPLIGMASFDPDRAARCQLNRRRIRDHLGTQRCHDALPNALVRTHHPTQRRASRLVAVEGYGDSRVKDQRDWVRFNGAPSQEFWIVRKHPRTSEVQCDRMTAAGHHAKPNQADCSFSYPPLGWHRQLARFSTLDGSTP
jgi:hypothetical protein